MGRKPLTSQRESNIELLRIITAIGVIVLHYNNADIGGAMAVAPPNSAGAWMLYFLEAMFLCAVDLFMMILGYFQSRKRCVSISKPILLLLQVSIVRVTAYLFEEVLIGGSLTIKGLFTACLPVNHFIAVYSTVYLLSPYLNLLLDHLSSKRKRILVFVLLFLLSLHPTALDLMKRVGFNLNSMSTISNTGSSNGYTLVNYVLMYILGAVCRDISFGKKSIVLFFACQLPLFALETICHIFDVSLGQHAYCHPLIIGCAFFALLSFKELQLGSRRWINELASGSLMVYLTHKLLFPLFDIKEAAAGGIVSIVLNLLLTCTVCYLAGWVFHRIYTFLSRPITVRLAQKLQRWTIDTSEPE